MPISAAVVTVTTAATLLSSGGDGSGTLRSVIIRNDSAVDVYVGGPTVTIATGLRIPATSYLPLDLDISDALYGIVAAGSEPVQVLRTRV